LKLMSINKKFLSGLAKNILSARFDGSVIKIDLIVQRLSL
jgi:hypothetical protein